MGKGIEKKRLIKKKLMLFIVVTIIVSLVLLPIVSDVAFAETATGTKVTYKGAISSMGSTCGKFTIKGRDAFCADHSAPTPPTGTKIKDTKEITKAAMRKALYYGYGGPKAKVSKNNAGWVSTSIALSRANGNGGGTTQAQKFYKSLKNYDTPPASFKVYYCTTSGNKQNLCYWIYEPKGKICIKKKSTDANATSSRGYALDGAVYGIYTDKGCSSSKLTTKLTTGTTGTSSKVTLGKGTYYIKEITAPKGFALSSTVYTVSVTDQCDKTITVEDAPKKGKIQIVKTSAYPQVTDSNSAYSLAGAKYKVWSDAGLTKEVGTLTTDGNGRSNQLSVLAGTYYIKEEVAPKGYLKDETTYTVKVETGSLGTAKVLNVVDFPEDEPAWVLLQKIDKETGLPAPSGDGTLAGAEFTVRYYEGTEWTENPAKSGEEEKGRWVFRTNENGFVSFDDMSSLVSGDEMYCNELGDPTFPIGTITIQESKAPKGYVRNDEVFVVKILKDDDEPGVSLSQIPTTEIVQQPIRGDLEIIKKDSKTGDCIKGVAFDVIDKSENKVVATITTDDNGYATTASGEKPEGSLLYGSYIVREKETPIGYLPIEDQEVIIDNHRETVTLEINNTPAEIKTNASFKENGEKEMIPEETVTIVDEVSYKNLIPGTTYKLKGILMDTLTGEKLLIDGKEVTAEMEFTAEESNGIIEMEFVVNAGELSGRRVTVFEYMYIDNTLVANHTDIDDADQTVTFTGVGDIEIYKGDSETGKPLEGVEFQIIDKLSGETVAKLVTDEMGYATTANEYTSVGALLYGDYIVRETEPLPGYMDIEEIETTVDDVNRTMSLKIDNTPIPIPDDEADTGDMMGRTIPLLIALMLIAIAGALMVGRKRERKI